MLQSYSGFWLQKKRIATRDSEEAQQGSARKGSPAFLCTFCGSLAGIGEVEKAYEVWKQNIYVSKSKKKRFSKILSIFSFLHILTIAILL